MTHILIAAHELQEPPLHWRPWSAIFLSGFITGATADLASLWLFAHWLHKGLIP